MFEEGGGLGGFGEERVGGGVGEELCDGEVVGGGL